MNLPRWGLPLAALLLFGACTTSAPRRNLVHVPAEALTDSTSIRLRCEDPEAVLAGRALCVLKDLPRGAVVTP